MLQLYGLGTGNGHLVLLPEVSPGCRLGRRLRVWVGFQCGIR